MGVVGRRWGVSVLAAVLVVSGLAGSAGALSADEVDTTVATPSPSADPSPTPGAEPAATTPSSEPVDSPTPSESHDITPPTATGESDSSTQQPDAAPSPEPVAALPTERIDVVDTFSQAPVEVRLAPLPTTTVASTAVTVTRVRTVPAVAEGTLILVKTRKGSGRWRVETKTAANAVGKAHVRLTPGPGRWRVRAVVLTDPRSRSNTRTLRVTRTRMLHLVGPTRADAGSDVILRASYAGTVAVPLTLQKKRAGTSRWRHVSTRSAEMETDGTARVRFTLTAARTGTWVYRVVKHAGPDGPRRVSAVHRLRIRPTGPPPFTSSVSRVRDDQVRYSHRAGCPVAVSQLRNLSVRYVDYSGSVRSGTVVVRADSVEDIRAVFRRAYEQRFPFKVVRPLEAYYAGGARSPHDSDVAAMNAGNTGAFNCRPVVGNPYRTSQHSYGNAIDYNTIQNPYVTASRVYPSAGVPYLDRSRYRTGMILPGSVVASTMASRGWPWGARWAYPDYQHFSSNGG